MAHAQAEHGQHDDAQTQGDGLRHLALVHHLACKQARGNESDGIDREEQAAADGQAHLFGIEGDVIRDLSVGESQQGERNASQQAFQQDETVQGDGRTLDGRPYFGLNP